MTTASTEQKKSSQASAIFHYCIVNLIPIHSAGDPHGGGAGESVFGTSVSHDDTLQRRLAAKRFFPLVEVIKTLGKVWLEIVERPGESDGA